MTGIEPEMGCDADPFNQYWVGRPTLCVRGTSSDRIDASSGIDVYGDGGGIRIGLHVEDILVSLVLS